MIDKERLYTYFAKNHGPLYKTSNGWYEGVCPFCGRPKLALNFIYKQAKCWRECFNGFAVDLIMKYHGIRYVEALDMIEEYDPTYIKLAGTSTYQRSDVILPEGYTPILFGEGIMGDRARHTLESRGMDLNYLDRIGVGYCNKEHKESKKNYFGYIIIPFKHDGILVYFIARDFTGNHLRYKNPSKEEYGIGKGEILFNEEALYLNEKIYVMEGWSDAATVGPAGVSIQGSDMGIYQRTKIIQSPVQEVVVIPDVGFYSNGLRIASKLISHKSVKVIDLVELKDLGKDVNQIGKVNVLSLEDHVPWLTRKTVYTELRHAS